MIAAIRLTILVFALGLFITYATATPPSASGATFTVSARTPTPSVSPTNNAPTPLIPSLAPQPRDITAVNNFEPSTRVGSLFDDRTYADHNVAGLTLRTSWVDIEPTDGDFSWAKLDTVFDNAEKNSKWVELVLIPGFGTPVWALQGVQTATFGVKYGPGKGDQLS